MKVLIVDDSTHALAVAKARLAKENLQIICAQTGQMGLEAASREKPDLILLDVDMPGLSGFEVCGKLKADPQLRTIPVIFLTAMAGAEQKVRGLDMGAVDYVTKPFDTFELQARVRAALRAKRFQDLLTEHARIDPVTELPNRRAIMECLQTEWARIQRHGGLLSLIMADVDRLKHINDTYGHNVGDRVLQEAGKAIASRCRKVDLAGRYGGDEFAVVAPGGPAADVLSLAERCSRAIEQIRINVAEAVVTTTASLGVADSANVSCVEELIERADAALYNAKNAGGNTARTADQPAETCSAAQRRRA